MASGDTLIQFVPQANEPPASGYATPDTRNGTLVLDFDASTDEAAIFKGVIPQHYTAGAALTVLIHYSMSSATTGDVVLTAAFERIGDGQQDIDSDGFAAAQSVTATVPATSGHVDIASISFTNAEADAIAKGEAFRLKISRDADNVADTSAGDLELIAVHIVEA